MPPQQEPSDILNLDIEQLSRVDVVAPSLDVEVTSVSRSESTVGKSPAAVFVITNEMIRRSGAREIPEVLRMVPGVNVARISANKWAVSIRGFNGPFANKLLVQIDGRTVYTPLFAGVYWDVQNVVLADVDRIEVIRGPGATVWGVNAVNGIINIITKNSKDTQGGYAEVGGGDQWNSYAVGRIGGNVTDDLTYRVYGQWFERDASHVVAPGYTFGETPNDGWRIGQGGFRMDWTPSDVDLITFTGEYYDGFSNSNTSVPGLLIFNQNTGETVRGAHALYRWAHKISDDSDWAIQAYYDRTERRIANPNFAGNNLDIYDIDFQHRFQLNYRNEIIWGAGYRYTDDFVRNSFGPMSTVSVFPNSKGLHTYSYFVQDRFTVVDDRWYVFLGSKFTHNTFAPFVMQPSARVLWTPTERQTIWAAVSRAVRTPSRADRGVLINLGGPIALSGNPNFTSEELVAYELGMRSQPSNDFFWDLAMFYNDYTNLSTAGPNPAPPPFLTLLNSKAHDQTWGFELASTYQVNPDWQIRGAYSFLRGSSSLGANILNSPRNQVYIQSGHNLGSSVFFDAIFRYTDFLPGGPPLPPPGYGPLSVPSYFVMDMRLAWRPTDRFEWYVIGRNLLDKNHNEFVASPNGIVGAEVPREVYTGVTLRY